MRTFHTRSATLLALCGLLMAAAPADAAAAVPEVVSVIEAPQLDALAPLVSAPMEYVALEALLVIAVEELRAEPRDPVAVPAPDVGAELASTIMDLVPRESTFRDPLPYLSNSYRPDRIRDRAYLKPVPPLLK